ncbi:MAG: hypothetical protein ABIN91_01570 [Mucilaginibacter sp.]|uniref:hypothetical protein n=1 Tax=Mucilaginibacter sp. TaxID=1882438 RepID=UPI003264EBF2
MVIGGKIRSNAPQLADYLLATGENERIMIMDVDGNSDADERQLKAMLYSMELNSELTRSKNSVYHAYINPNPDDTTDRAMTMEEWQQSVDLLTDQLGYQDQRKVVVLHEKPGNRVHAHVVYERYNHERGVMATYEHNYEAHDRAREQMEKKFVHKRTPVKNKNRDHHKQTLTKIWQRTNTAAQFMQEAEANGYKIAKGTDRPYRVVDSDGIGFDLVRKLDGIKTSDVKARFGETELMPEKEAIRVMQSAKQERQNQQSIPTESSPEKTPAPDATAQDQARQKFLQNIKDVRERNRSLTREITLSFVIALKVMFSFRNNLVQQRNTIKEQFIACTHETTARQELKASAKILGFMEAAQFYKPT